MSETINSLNREHYADWIPEQEGWGAIDPEDWTPEQEGWGIPDDERTVELDGGND